MTTSCRMSPGVGDRDFPTTSDRRNGGPEPSGVIAHNVATVAALEATTLGQRTAAERAANGIARIAGTPSFALLHLTLFGTWIVGNTGLVPGWPVFDPYPFSLLTLVVSLEAIFLSIFVLVSQNRLTRQADRRAHLDLRVNPLAEQESPRAVELLHRITDHLGVPRDQDDGELAKPTSVRDVVSTLERTLPSDWRDADHGSFRSGRARQCTRARLQAPAHPRVSR